jgi:hypothetical protein
MGPLLWLGWALLAWLHPGLDEHPIRLRAFVRAVVAGLVMAATRFYSAGALLGVAALAVTACLPIAADLRLGRYAKAGTRGTQVALVALLCQLGLVPAWGAGIESGGPMAASFVDLAPRLRLLLFAFQQFVPTARFGPPASGQFAYFSGWPFGAFPEEVSRSLLVDTPTSIFLSVILLVALVGLGKIARDTVRSWPARPAIEAVFWTVLFFGSCLSFLIQPLVKDYGSCRYGMIFFFPLVVFVGRCLEDAKAPLRRVLALGWLFSCVTGHGRMLRLEEGIHEDLDRVVAYLDHRHVTAGVGDYWVCYALAALTEERITLVPSKDNRYPRYNEKAWNQDLLVRIELEHVVRRGAHVTPPPAMIQLDEQEIGRFVVTLYGRATKPPP